MRTIELLARICSRTFICEPPISGVLEVAEYEALLVVVEAQKKIPKQIRWPSGTTMLVCMIIAA